MAETRLEAWATVAALLTRMGYSARVEPGYRPVIPGVLAQPGTGTVLALVTCAPEMVIGMCLGQVAEEPEANLPDRSVKVAKSRLTEPGPPLFAHWCDNNE